MPGERKIPFTFDEAKAVRARVPFGAMTRFCRPQNSFFPLISHVCRLFLDAFSPHSSQ